MLPTLVGCWRAVKAEERADYDGRGWERAVEEQGAEWLSFTVMDLSEDAQVLRFPQTSEGSPSEWRLKIRGELLPVSDT